MTVGQRLVYYRDRAGLKQIELAEKVGITKQLLWKYETDRVTNIPINNIATIADVLHVDPAVLVGWREESDDSYKFISFPVIGEVAAGYEHFAEEDTFGSIEIPEDWLNGRKQSDYFVLRVAGDSMFPTYQDGDLVLILRQSTFNYSGQIGVVVYDDNLGTLKKVEYVYGEDWMRLVPINPAYPPVTITNERLEHCRVLGIAKMVIREVR